MKLRIKKMHFLEFGNWADRSCILLQVHSACTHPALVSTNYEVQRQHLLESMYLSSDPRSLKFPKIHIFLCMGPYMIWCRWLLSARLPLVHLCWRWKGMPSFNILIETWDGRARVWCARTSMSCLHGPWPCSISRRWWRWLAEPVSSQH